MKEIIEESKQKIKQMTKDEIVYQMQSATGKPDFKYSKSIDDIEFIDDGMEPYEHLMMPLPKNELEYRLYSSQC